MPTTTVQLSQIRAIADVLYASVETYSKRLQSNREDWEAAQSWVASWNEMDEADLVTVDIGGTVFRTCRQTLIVPDSMLFANFSGMFGDDEVEPEDNAIFLDRDGDLFSQWILPLLRDEKAISPVDCFMLPDWDQKQLQREVTYFALDELVERFGDGHFVRSFDYFSSLDLASFTTDMAQLQQLRFKDFDWYPSTVGLVTISNSLHSGYWSMSGISMEHKLEGQGRASLVIQPLDVPTDEFQFGFRSAKGIEFNPLGMRTAHRNAACLMTTEYFLVNGCPKLKMVEPTFKCGMRLGAHIVWDGTTALVWFTLNGEEIPGFRVNWEVDHDTVFPCFKFLGPAGKFRVLISDPLPTQRQVFDVTECDGAHVFVG
eukprot:TRINITY_DN86131_c0_g1_i1.p1 TRINITY_DN86131_c0_g1~~TRINITY_DN86131_c0_g1_i1.p1  ORF type:complete len:372 (-),score=26.72 TRINITY_DN86131_c0_g1_i1:96-1211(-)